MRKPLVVVCAAASAMVLGGVLVATSAGAEETPDVPGISGWSMPDFSGLFGGGGDDDASFDGDGVGADGSSGDDGSSDGSSSDDSSDDDTVDDDRAPGFADDDAPADDVDRDTAGGADASGHLRAVPQKPAQARPDAPRAAGERPAAQRPAQRPAFADDAAQHAPAQRPATNLMAAAKRGVTSSDISASPSAPVQQHVLVLVNENRRRGGCGNLSLDRRLIDAANEHAADMARKRYFAHESPNGEGAGDRVSEAGYRWKRYGENIARGVDNAYEVVDGWMHSPAHRENIMDCSLHQMGIGLAIAGDDTAYWVQDFATPMS